MGLKVNMVLMAFFQMTRIRVRASLANVVAMVVKVGRLDLEATLVVAFLLVLVEKRKHFLNIYRSKKKKWA